ncbi:MAG: rRNA synthase [Candidatus Petromonas sp.]|jgi:23S rRNA pseudouridine1911/1915/1917 synthase|nr:rRNA synthase [Candidatus Petromonas sp.]
MKNIGDSSTLIYEVEKKESGITLKEVLYKKMKLSGRLTRKAKRKKNIFVNDNNISLGSKLRTGDIVKVIMDEERNQFEPQDIPISIVYEDMDLLIIDKQPNVVVHPTKGHPNNTIANGLVNYLIKSNQHFKTRFVNRLDRDTSGLLIVAKNPFAHQVLSKQMSKNLVEKKYLAVVKGRVDKDCGTIDEPIGRTEDDSVRREVVQGGRESVTHFEVVKRYKNASLVRLKLDTGRTHQIRVHMKYIGHPLIGDELYGYVDESLINRQALHAESLRFYQPRTGELKFVKAEIPQDIKELLRKLST